MEKCPNCGGIFPLNSFVCDYCGYVETEKLKKVSDTKIKEISFDESLNIIQDNLTALHNLNKPSAKKGVLKALRIIAAIHTLGIVLIFWKKPKEGFNKKSYDILKRIIQRNIDQLRISSIGSIDLLSRIDIVEKELHATDTEIKKNLRAKQITTAIVIGAYILFFITNPVYNLGSSHTIYPLENSVTGDLDTLLEVIYEPYKLRFSGKDNLSHFIMQIKLLSLKSYQLNDSNELKVTLMLTDSAGIQSDYFLPTEIEAHNIRTILRGLKRKYPGVFITFSTPVREKKVMTKIPENLTNFKIHTEINQK